MKILNLYSGIGGNRKLWPDHHDIVSVENDIHIAKEYKKFFPKDEIVIDDAHLFLEKHYNYFDFIWTSPPCPSHGQYRYNIGFKAKKYKAIFPDMKLYEEIIFLQYYFSGKYVIENTKPFYQPLIKPTAILQRHLFWSNFIIPNKKFEAKHIRSKNKISDYEDIEFDISQSKIKNKRQVLRNCVDLFLGLYIFETMLKS